MYRKILLAYDGSPSSKKAFESACTMAARDNAELFIVSVARPMEIADDVETEAFIENARASHRRMLAGLKAELTSRNLKAHLDVAVGHPAEQIIREADRRKVDVIVVGDRGRSKFARLMLGSTSKQVVEHAGRPVLVVR